jgi:hypothetical protein
MEERHIDLPRTYVVGPRAHRNRPRLAVAGLVVFALLAVFAIAIAAYLGVALRR